MSRPACSVVIPWHGNHDDLAQAVASVFAQTEQDFEIIVVANNVDDDTYARAANLSDDPRYRIVRLGRANAPIARNRGLDIADGDLVFFLDSDDLFFPGKLAAFRHLHETEGFDVAFSRGTRQRGDGVSWPFPIGHWNGDRPLSEFFFCDGCTISASAIVMAASASAKLRFDERFVPYEDPDLMMRAAHAGLRLVMLPDQLYQWSDARTENRLSRADNHAMRLAWIDQTGPTATERAKAAFRARCVAQHDFPRRPMRSLAFFWRAVAAGAVPAADVARFALRGLLPSGLRRRLLNRHFKSRERALGPAASRGG